MLTTRESIILQGSSYLVINEEKILVASLSATINGNDINITKTISNKEMFDAHKEEVQKDFDEFDDYVYNHK